VSTITGLVECKNITVMVISIMKRGNNGPQQLLVLMFLLPLKLHSIKPHVLFCSLAVFDSRVGHTMDILSPFISFLCHSD